VEWLTSSMTRNVILPAIVDAALRTAGRRILHSKMHTLNRLPSAGMSERLQVMDMHWKFTRLSVLRSQETKKFA